MIWLIPIALGLLALAAGGGRTFGPREGLAKREIPKDTRFVLWIDDARSAAVFRKDGELFASVANGKTEVVGPIDEIMLNDAVGASEFLNSAVRYESLVRPWSWDVMPAEGEWHWVSRKGPVVQSGVATSRTDAIGQAWSTIGGVS